jgi:hypothetical protein
LPFGSEQLKSLTDHQGNWPFPPQNRRIKISRVFSQEKLKNHL